MFFIQFKKKIIPAFEKVYGPEYQAMFVVHNSQGHSAYAEDALVANHININLVEKQACLYVGWFEWDDQKTMQKMIYPLNDPTNSNKPKGLCAILEERGINLRQMQEQV
ncbi:hypothetical protein C0995_016216 [Termitomyces sp. Mi166|nr:hypothetical protein C0995_016216 [Termitomyces sp. Mi166\